MAEKKLKIGEILVAAGVLKEEQLADALRSQSHCLLYTSDAADE